MKTSELGHGRIPLLNSQRSRAGGGDGIERELCGGEEEKG